MDDRKTAWIALNMAGVGPSRAQKLTEAFGSPQDALVAPKEKLKEVAGIGEVVSDRIHRLGKDKAGEKEFEQAAKKGIKIITSEEESYPYLLKQIYDPPVVLYVKGEILDSDKNSIGMVGSRHASIQGRLTAEKLSIELASRGITIVSGMARGIDTSAHNGALRAKGRTIALIW